MPHGGRQTGLGSRVILGPHDDAVRCPGPREGCRSSAALCVGANWLLLRCHPESVFTQVHVEVNFRSPARIGLPCSLKLHLKNMGNAIRQKSRILRHLRCPSLKMPPGILRSLFQNWVEGLVWLTRLTTSSKHAFVSLFEPLRESRPKTLPFTLQQTPIRSSTFASLLATEESAECLLYPVPTRSLAASGHRLIRIPRTQLSCFCP